jgi:hypothetical protein
MVQVSRCGRYGPVRGALTEIRRGLDSAQPGGREASPAVLGGRPRIESTLSLGTVNRTLAPGWRLGLAAYSLLEIR